ncbi:MAG TPA: hypothetical protein DCZ03_10340 [Gammaproteobacteria bacterium]|nr:hypothetical protein [Gammaproteobacteria bacterium]
MTVDNSIKWRLMRFNDFLKSSRLVREIATLRVVVPAVLNIPPELNSAAPISSMSAHLSKPYIICFIRHVGCPFAEMTVKLMSQIKEDHKDMKLFLVSHCPLRETESWLKKICPHEDMMTIIDEEHEMYGQWGLGCTSLWHFVGWGSLISLFKLARLGVVNRLPSGSRWQQAGAFAVGRSGQVVWRHLPQHAGDLPDFEEAVSVIRGAGTGKLSRVS